jgi:hypothetical protein
MAHSDSEGAESFYLAPVSTDSASCAPCSGKNFWLGTVALVTTNKCKPQYRTCYPYWACYSAVHVIVMRITPGKKHSRGILKVLLGLVSLCGRGFFASVRI